MRIGNRVIFYKAGLDGRKFLGCAKIESDLKKETNLGYSIVLTEIEIWKESVDIEELLGKLEFIKDKQVWGRFFQGGVRKISGGDYSTILQ